MAENPRREAAISIQSALVSPLPRLYVNSFMNAASDSDVISVLQCNGINIAVMNVSYTFAKTYARALMALVEEFEEKHKLKVPEHEVASALGTMDPVTGKITNA
ncbi:MAG TPA: hypothetical protein VHU23_11360 [Rhizomicrobium sp.]|jgi:hypothetical protein|nr:hypothetical protein [Rhizomicrobium sp.]